jgi:hypothetical protein
MDFCVLCVVVTVLHFIHEEAGSLNGVFCLNSTPLRSGDTDLNL